ncbi:MAG: C4-dicarboxylate ABC transporter [Prevotella sp.]|nr:C4-dicarboxylate ABC transporter [Prevotella sp.]
MPKGKDLNRILQPLSKCSLQSYLGRGVHTLGLLDWILRQTGRADVYVSTFSMSDAFLRGFFNLKKKGLIGHSVLLADLKASKKTVKLYREMQCCFDSVYLAMNHSKVVLVQNERHLVTVISSQNQTYGDRAECTVITSSQELFLQQYSGFKELVDENSIQLNGLFTELVGKDHGTGENTDTAYGDWRPFGSAD